MVTMQEFDSFAEYARIHIENGRASTLSQLLTQWETQREEAEDVKAIARGIADMEAGRVVPLDQAMAEVRQKLGLPS
jgi:predicted transcriptional regulator